MPGFRQHAFQILAKAHAMPRPSMKSTGQSMSIRGSCMQMTCCSLAKNQRSTAMAVTATLQNSCDAGKASHTDQSSNCELLARCSMASGKEGDMPVALNAERQAPPPWQIQGHVHRAEAAGLLLLLLLHRLHLRAPLHGPLHHPQCWPADELHLNQSTSCQHNNKPVCSLHMCSKTMEASPDSLHKWCKGMCMCEERRQATCCCRQLGSAAELLSVHIDVGHGRVCGSGASEQQCLAADKKVHVKKECRHRWHCADLWRLSAQRPADLQLPLPLTVLPFAQTAAYPGK